MESNDALPFHFYATFERPDGTREKLNSSNFFSAMRENWKPVLRRLDTLSHADFTAIGKIEHPDLTREVERWQMGSVVMQYFKKMGCLPETFRYLINTDTDVFGLIETGKAIDISPKKEPVVNSAEFNRLVH